jgi:hypothetical protein
MDAGGRVAGVSEVLGEEVERWAAGEGPDGPEMTFVEGRHLSSVKSLRLAEAGPSEVLIGLLGEISRAGEHSPSLRLDAQSPFSRLPLARYVQRAVNRRRMVTPVTLT